MKKLAVVLVPLLLMACTTAPKTASNQAPGNQNGSASASAAAAANAAELAAIEARKLAEERDALQKQSIYFDFDKSDIKHDGMAVVQREAAFAKAHGNDVVTVSGNADERGSEEYNLALGDRRANAASKEMEALGVAAAQIKTVSYGEEKPRLACHAEKCWKENRRDDFSHAMGSMN